MGMMPRARRLRVAGIFRLGLYEFDATYGFISLPLAARLLDKNADLIELRVKNFLDAPAIAQHIADTFGPDYWVQDWADMNKSLYSALWLEKMAISITIGLIVAVAALNIIASLVLLVMEKSRDIAILKTMGATRRSVMVVFMLQGLIIGLVGTIAGAVLGMGVSWTLDRYQLIKIPADVYQVSHVPFVVLPLDFAVVVASAVVICFLATIYPSRQAAKLDPVQALRFE
jgi:lipoprotein-releasing system permease protein